MENRYLTVTALNKYIKNKIDCDVQLQSIFIKGEISNLKNHRSGHLYFTLKDENSRISAVMFSSKASKLNFELKDGMKVLIQANVSVYDVAGTYQLYINSVEQDGLGNLYLQYEQLKKKLSNEGLFDDIHKKPIPHYPSKIAVMSAYPSAALMDILRTIKQRYPVARVIVFPIPVQGKDAYKKIIETLNYVDQLHFSTIIIARGGGSLEDLWNFNEEALAYSLYQANTPIISGVGHEVDYTICDFVSDYRGATPTAAAVKATPDMRQMTLDIRHIEAKLIQHIQYVVDTHKSALENYENFYLLKNPEKLYQNLRTETDFLSERLHNTFLKKLENDKHRIAYLNDTFTLKQSHFISSQKQHIDYLDEQMHKNIELKLKNNQERFYYTMSRLNTLSPLKTIERGYSIVFKDKKVVSSKNDLQSGQHVRIKFHDGSKNAIID